MPKETRHVDMPVYLKGGELWVPFKDVWYLLSTGDMSNYGDAAANIYDKKFCHGLRLMPIPTGWTSYHVRLVDVLDPAFRKAAKSKQKALMEQLDTQLLPLYMAVMFYEPAAALDQLGLRAPAILGVRYKFINMEDQLNYQDKPKRVTPVEPEASETPVAPVEPEASETPVAPLQICTPDENTDVDTIKQFNLLLWKALIDLMVANARFRSIAGIKGVPAHYVANAARNSPVTRETIQSMLESASETYYSENKNGKGLAANVLYEKFSVAAGVSLTVEQMNRQTASRLDTVIHMGKLDELYQIALHMWGQPGEKKLVGLSPADNSEFYPANSASKEEVTKVVL